MKKTTRVFAIIFLLMVLTACSSEDSNDTRTFEYKDEGSNVTVTYKSEGNKVVEQSVEFVASYTDLGIASKEEAKEIFDAVSQQNDNAKGISETVDYTDTEVITTLTIDFNKVDLAEVTDLPGMDLDGDKAKGIKMDKAVEQLKEEGFTEVK